MRASPTQIQRLADRIVDAIMSQGYVKLEADEAAVRRRLALLLQQNMDEEAAIEEEAERVAAGHARKMAGMDQRKVIEMIKRRLAEERGFTL